MSGFFISYRRSDTSEEAHRLYEWLRSSFQQTDVFIDIDRIDPGADFGEVIDEKVGFCDAVIAVIGRGWLTATDQGGQRRLDDPDDWVRLEIGSALRRGIPVVPVLVDGAVLPAAHELPKPLAGLAKLQATILDGDLARRELGRLRSALERMSSPPHAAGLWLSVLTRGHRALDPLDLNTPEMVWRSLRFLFFMILLSDLLRLPFIAEAAGLTNPLAFAAYVAGNTIEWLGAGIVLHAFMRLFGGRGTLAKSTSAYCIMSAYVPLVAVAQCSAWGLHVTVFGASEGDLAAGLGILQQTMAEMSRFDVLRLFFSFAAATTLWVFLVREVLGAFRTLHRIGRVRCALAAGTALLGYLLFLRLFYEPFIAQVYSGFAPAV